MPESAHVKLSVYDALGRKIAVLVDAQLDTGTHEVSFDAIMLPSGMYLYRLETPAGHLIKSMLLTK